MNPVEMVVGLVLVPVVPVATTTERATSVDSLTPFAPYIGAAATGAARGDRSVSSLTVWHVTHQLSPPLARDCS
jgi:hypothetical protein